jgi:hypothetical protein
MDIGKPFDYAFERVSLDDENKWDAVVSQQDLCLADGSFLFPQAVTDGFDGGLTLSPWAQAQACQKLGIPTAYFKKCPTYLQDAQFNFWASQPTGDDTKLLIRSKGAMVRGVLSKRYAKLDNRQILEALRPIMVGSTYRVGMCDIGDEAFHLRLVNPGLFRDILPGDRLFVGIHIANSEVGLRSVSVEAMVYRLLCSNGLVRRVDSQSLMRQRHVSLSPERFQERLADAIAQAATVAAGFLETLHLSARTRIIEPDTAVPLIAEAWSLPQATEQLIRFVMHGEDACGTLYGLINGITSAAQRLSMEDRYALEVRAGQLIDPNGPDSLLRQRILLASPGGML